MSGRIIGGILFLLAGIFSLQAQSWAPVGSGITGENPNTTWALCAYDSVLYAGGWFNNAGGVPVQCIAQWNGSTWDSVGIGTDGYINALTVYNGHLYAGGQFAHIGGIAASDIAVWNGIKWLPAGAGLKGGDYGVYALAVYNGKLFAGGSFDSSGNKAMFGLAEWNDTDWSEVGAITPVDEDDGVFTLAVYKGNLYAGGDFTIAGGPNIARWDGQTFSGVQGGTVGYIYSLAVYNDNLYVGGMLSLAGVVQANGIAIWNNTTWEILDSAGITGENSWASVNALTVYNNELYIGGFFDTVNGQRMNCITKWDGKNFSPVGSGINTGGDIDAITVYNGSLCIGGGFDSAGGVYAKNIAMLTELASVDELNENNGSTVYPNPGNGMFTLSFHSEPAMADEESNPKIEVYNVLGQQVYSSSAQADDNAINLYNQPNGIYLYRVVAQTGGLVGEGKLVIQK